MLRRVFAQMLAASLAILVVDGDSIRVDGQPVRIVGYDAPEMRGACEAEKRAAQAAKAELERFLSTGVVTAQLHSRRLDRWNRGLWHVYVDGRSVADHMIRSGHGRPYDGGKRASWC